MAFKRIGSLTPHGAPVLKKSILANSITSVILDSMKLASGFSALGTAGALVFGHLMAHSDKYEVGVSSTGIAGAAMGSYVGSFASASDNQTVAKVTADCDISKHTLYSAEVSAAIGTTTGSNLAGYRMDLTDEDTLDESTATTSTAQYNTWGVDPNNSAQAVVNIYESQVFGV
jgi:hypothetical protein